MPPRRAERSTAMRPSLAAPRSTSTRQVPMTRPSRTATTCSASASRPSTSSGSETPCSSQKTAWRSARAASSSAGLRCGRTVGSAAKRVPADVGGEPALARVTALVDERLLAVRVEEDRVGQARARHERLHDRAARVRVGGVGLGELPEEAPGVRGVVGNVEAEEGDAPALLDRLGLEERELEPAGPAPRRPPVDHEGKVVQGLAPPGERRLPAAEELAGLAVQGAELGRRSAQRRLGGGAGGRLALLGLAALRAGLREPDHHHGHKGGAGKDDGGGPRANPRVAEGERSNRRPPGGGRPGDRVWQRKTPVVKSGALCWWCSGERGVSPDAGLSVTSGHTRTPSRSASAAAAS